MASNSMRKLATRYVLCGEQLYKRSFNHVLLRCLTEEEVQQVMHEVHAGVCGGHVNTILLAKKRIFFFYHGGRLLLSASCPPLPQVSNSRGLDPRASIGPPCHNHTLAFSNVGLRCHRQDLPHGLELALFYSGSDGVFHEMGRSRSHEKKSHYPPASTRKILR